VKDIHERAVEARDANELRKILSLLDGWGIKRRQKDGELLWTNLSIPTSIGGTIAIGYRYWKRDSTLTEDIFELNQNNPDEIGPYYKGAYQDVRSEYERTHKQQGVEARSFTTVNTCCLYLGGQNGS
jgi:hypothetical protein